MIRRILLAISFVIALAVLGPHAAKANQYPLCTHPGYLAYIDERLSPQTCEIIHSAPIVWRGGRSTIRAIRLSSAAPMTNIRAVSADIDAAAAGMGRAMDQLGGSLTLPPITVLFTDYVSPGAARDNTFRKGAYQAAATDILEGECPVGYYKNADATSPAYFTFILTHEVFHCAQYQNWPRMLDQQWLTEATAEYFAYLAQPDFGQGFITDFDNGTQSTPLGRMAYEAVPFWLWMGNKDGPPAVRDFIPRATADLPTMINADMLLDFAEAYFDSTIKMPDGTTAMPSTPRVGGTHVVNGSEHIAGASFTPYTLNERIIEFPAHKRYTITYSPPLAPDQRMVWRKDSGGAWGPPLTDVVTCDGAQRFRMLYASTNTSKFSDIDIRVENGGGAGVCTCPLGTWQETPASLKRYFEQTGFEAYAPSQIEYIGGGRTLRLNPDHTGSLTYDSVETIVRTSDPRIWLRQIKTGGTHFTWKVLGNMLLTIYTGGNNLITMQNEQHGPNGVLNETRRGPPQSIGHRFRCDETGLHLIQLPTPPLPAGMPATTFRVDMDFARGG